MIGDSLFFIGLIERAAAARRLPDPERMRLFGPSAVTVTTRKSVC
jgi:hypothetical protein